MWLELAYSSIQFLLFVCLAAHAEEFLDGLQEMSNCYCHPGKTGSSPFANRNRDHKVLTRIVGEDTVGDVKTLLPLSHDDDARFV